MTKISVMSLVCQRPVTVILVPGWSSLGPELMSMNRRFTLFLKAEIGLPWMHEGRPLFRLCGKRIELIWTEHLKDWPA